MFIAGIIIVGIILVHVIGWVVTVVEDVAETMGRIVDDGPGDTGPSHLDKERR